MNFHGKITNLTIFLLQVTPLAFMFPIGMLETFNYKMNCIYHLKNPIEIVKIKKFFASPSLYFCAPNLNDCIFIKSPPPQYIIILFLRIILYITRKKTLGLEMMNTPYLLGKPKIFCENLTIFTQMFVYIFLGRFNFKPQFWVMDSFSISNKIIAALLLDTWEGDLYEIVTGPSIK